MTAQPAPLKIYLLGELEVKFAGRPWAAPASRRAQALLAYLALRPGPNRRDEVAAELWPDVLDSSARGSLRSAIWTLRRAFGDRAVDRLIATRAKVGVVDDTMLWIDLRAFAAAVRAGRYETALELRRGALLEGFDDEWVLAARDEFDHLAGEASLALIRAALERGDSEAAIRWARARVREVPRDEEAARALMTALASRGERAAALEVHRRLADRLRRELAVAPAAATRELASSIRDHAAAPPDRHVVPPVPVIGRDDELRRLDAASRSLRAGRIGVASISGEAGIGKTTLARELLRRAAADGARIAAGAGSTITDPPPYALWAELMRDLDDGFEGGSTLDDHAPPELRRARLRERALDLVDQQTTEHRVALLLDDAHTADRSSLELVGYVARRLPARPLLVVVTRRSFPASPSVDGLLHCLRVAAHQFVCVDVQPLPPPRVAEIVRENTRLDPHGIHRAVALADGNPFLALEAARALERGEDPAAGLGAMVRDAIGRLSTEARGIAELAAVTGGRLTGQQLLELRAPQAVERALESGLFTIEREGIQFRHALLRDAVRGEILPTQRAVLHERAASLATEPTQRAHHLGQAGRRKLAAAALKEAADRALAVGALHEAAGLLGDAIELDGREPHLRLRLARAEAWRGNGDAAATQLRAALELHDARDHPALGQLWLEAAQWYRSSLCDPTRTRAAAERALRHLEADGREDALAAYAWSQAMLGELDEADRLATAAARLDPLGRLAFDLALIRAHAKAMRGDAKGSLEAARDAAAAVRPAGRPDLAYSVWMHAGAVAAFAGDLSQSLVHVERCIEEVGALTYLRVPALAARGYVLARLDRHDEAQSDADRQLELARSATDSGLLSVAEHDAGMILLEGGRYRGAVAHLTTALEMGARVSRASALLARAEAYARLSRAVEADADLRAVTLIPLRPADAPHTLVPRLTWVQGLVAHSRGDAVLARRRLEEAVAGWRRLLVGPDEGPMETWVANIVDLGRPPAAGLVEPARELERTLADLESNARNAA